MSKFWLNLTFEAPLSYAQFKFVFKSLHNIALYLFKSYFINYSHIYSSRRNGLDISIPKCIQNLKERNILYWSPRQAFNNLPLHLMEVDSIVIFKTQLRYDISF